MQNPWHLSFKRNSISLDWQGLRYKEYRETSQIPGRILEKLVSDLSFLGVQVDPYFERFCFISTNEHP